MGLESRDYIRESPPGGGYGYTFHGGGRLWAIKYLIIANIVVFVLQLATMDAAQGGITAWLQLSRLHLTGEAGHMPFQIWRLVTYGFCHGGMAHIFFNLLVLWFFGRLVEPIYGSKEFLCFFLVGVVISGLCHVGWQFLFPAQAARPVVGASGGVMSTVFLTAMIFPRERVYVMFVIPMEMRVMAVLYAVLDLIGAMNPQSGVAHWAHLGGAAFGVAYRYYDWRILGFWDAIRRRFRFRGPRRRPKVGIYQPEEPPREHRDRVEDKVDELLEKISRHGESSLTDDEREFLADASRRYRNR